jgi:hypothetical protein
MPTQVDSPAFGVLEQFSVGTIQEPLTCVTTLLDGTTYPDQFEL